MRRRCLEERRLKPSQTIDEGGRTRCRCGRRVEVKQTLSGVLCLAVHDEPCHHVWSPVDSLPDGTEVLACRCGATTRPEIDLAEGLLG